MTNTDWSETQEVLCSEEYKVLFTSLRIKYEMTWKKRRQRKHTRWGLRSSSDGSLNLSLHEYCRFPFMCIIPWWLQYSFPRMRLLIVVVTWKRISMWQAEFSFEYSSNPWVSRLIMPPTLLHLKISPSSNSTVKTPTGSTWIDCPQNLDFTLLSPQNFQPLPSEWQAISIGWWLTYPCKWWTATCCN